MELRKPVGAIFREKIVTFFSSLFDIFLPLPVFIVTFKKNTKILLHINQRNKSIQVYIDLFLVTILSKICASDY